VVVKENAIQILQEKKTTEKHLGARFERVLMRILWHEF